MKCRLPCLIVLALVLAGCGGDASGPPGPTEGTLVIRNACAFSIAEVNFSRCSDTQWGSNRLAAGDSIAVGTELSWAAASGCYDVRVRAAGRDWVARFGIDIRTGEVTVVTFTSL
jgi:hypothetical protein